MIRIAVLLVMLLPWTVGCRGAPTELVSKECGVAITMPGAPIYEPVTFVVQGESVTNHQSRVLQDGVTYGFICTVSPGLADGHTPEEQLASARQGLLLSGNKKLIAEHSVMLQGQRGLELVMAMTASGDTLRNRVFMFPNTAVSISVIGSNTDVALPVADRFLDSLRLQNQ
jgi:hypothetical protein